MAVTALTNGNYVVTAPEWNGKRGAAAWGSGVSGLAGSVSSANSLIGTTENDRVGDGGVTALSNGNYVVLSQNWQVYREAVTWGNGATGVTGEVSNGNSLTVDVTPSYVDIITARSTTITGLRNGNYLVCRPSWNSEKGAATWGAGTSGITGVVSAANSLIGSTRGQRVGGRGITELSNGNFVVLNPGFTTLSDPTPGDVSSGSVTWGSGMTGVTGTVSVSNSLMGSHFGDVVGSGGVAALRNGNYVVLSPDWNEKRGAATWGNGASGEIGEISETNSLIGTDPDDQAGLNLIPLTNGNYLVLSPWWDDTSGAATWGSGTSGVTGEISSSNSLVGNLSGNWVGDGGIALKNGNFAVVSPRWGSGRGAVTWGNGTQSLVGFVSPANSLVGTRTADDAGGYGVEALENGNYVVHSADWNDGRGAVTWGSGTSGVAGEISAENSLVGSVRNDHLGTGYYGVTGLKDGNYILFSGWWDNADLVNAGAETLADGSAPLTGPVSSANSILGLVSNGTFAAIQYDAWSRLVVGDWPSNRVSIRTLPAEISLSGKGVAIADGKTEPFTADGTDFGGAAPVTGKVTRAFVIQNSGQGPLSLTGTPVVAVIGTNTADFTVTAQPGPLLKSGVSTVFEVVFTPGAVGPRTAVLSIASDDADEAVYNFVIQGRGWTEVEGNWRTASFGAATELTGMDDDFDGDGVSNLLEFAFGTGPADRASGPAPLRYEGSLQGGGSVAAPGQPVTLLEGNVGSVSARAVFTRRKDYAAAGLVYAVQFSQDLNAWQDSGIQPTVLADNGTVQVVSVPYPLPDNPRKSGFFRIVAKLQP